MSTETKPTRVQFNVNTSVAGRSWRAGEVVEIDEEMANRLLPEITSGLCAIVEDAPWGDAPPAPTGPPAIQTVGTFDSTDAPADPAPAGPASEQTPPATTKPAAGKDK